MNEQLTQNQEQDVELTFDKAGYDRASEIQDRAWEVVRQTPEYKARDRAQDAVETAQAAVDRAQKARDRADETLKQTPEWQAWSRATDVCTRISKKIWPHFWR